MDSETERTDTVTNITPKSMTRGSTQKFVFILLFVIGLVSIGYSAYLIYKEGKDWVPEFGMAIGVAILTPAILSYAYRKYLMEDIKAELEEPVREFKDEASAKLNEVIDDIKGVISKEINLLKSAHFAGLVGIYRDRDEALEAFKHYLEEEKNEITIIGSSLLGFLQNNYKARKEAREILLNKLSDKDFNIKFLLTHPAIADLRAEQEDRQKKAIGKEIIASLEFLLNDWKIPIDNIKLYQGTPTCFAIKTEKAMLLNFYPYMKIAYASVSIIVEKDGEFYRQYDYSHFQAWGSKQAKPVPQNLKDIESNLDDFANKINKILALGIISPIENIENQQI